MKKISVFLILALLLSVQTPSQAGFLAEQKTKIEQKKVYKIENNEIKKLFANMIEHANNHNFDGLMSLYSKDFVNSDGFNFDIYSKMVKETWETYPDISYSTKINNIELTDNYARVLVTEIAVSAPVEQIENFETVGELYSTSKCIYHLEKHGTKWLIASEDILEETSALKYEAARHVSIELDTPKQIGAGKYYTTTLKISNMPAGYSAVASIGKEKIVYPQTKADDNFRRISSDNTLERVFISNKDNVNEYAIASVGLAQMYKNGENIDVQMNGLAFIMTRVNVVPENKFVKLERDKNEQSK